MKSGFLCLIAGASVFATSLTAQAVTLSPSDIHGGDSSTTTFSDGNLTLNPLIGTTPSTFNNNPTRLGNDDNGTNAQAFNDPDTDPNNDNDERLEFIFSPTAGLSQMTWDFSRTDGAAPSGVTISGFAANPGATLSGGNMLDSSSASYSAGSLNLQLEFATSFTGNPGVLDLANLGASAGQTLLLRVHDTDEAGAQLAILSISYESVPEPSSLLLASLASVALLKRRK